MITGRPFNLAVLCSLSAALSSCQEALKIQVRNDYPVAVTVRSIDTTVEVQPGRSVVVPFPSNQNGSLLRIAVAAQWHCYRLDRPGLQIDELPVDKHRLVQSRLDAALRLHFANAVGKPAEQVVEGASCGPA